MEYKESNPLIIAILAVILTIGAFCIATPAMAEGNSLPDVPDQVMSDMSSKDVQDFGVIEIDPDPLAYNESSYNLSNTSADFSASGSVYSGEITGVTITPERLVNNQYATFRVDVKNTGAIQTCYQLEWYSNGVHMTSGFERTIDPGDTETFSWNATMGSSGDREYEFDLYWDRVWYLGSNVFLDSATVYRYCYAAGLPDIYEPDDDSDHATNISTNGEAQYHDFHDSGDGDWVKFYMEQGEVCTVETTTIGDMADTYLTFCYYDGVSWHYIYDDDGGVGRGSKIVHTCTHAGECYVKVRQYTSSVYGETTAYSISVYVEGGAVNQPPSAVITYTTNSDACREGTSISFISTGSSDPDGTIVSYDWTFGDGDVGAGEITSHVYTTTGNMIVTLTVTDNEGATCTDNVTINVLPAVGDVDTVTRDLPASVGVGVPITVNLTVDVETGATFYFIDEIVPSGWTVTSATDGGDYTSETGHVKWVVTSGATDATYSYTVLVPTDASGAYTFGGTYMFEGMAAEATILGDTTVTVGDVDTVTRDLPVTAGAGAPITVDLAVDVETGATFYSIDEIVPSGWTVTSATDGGDYTTTPGHVFWTVTSGAADKTYSYTVEVPAGASGAYTFDGIYAFEGMTDEATILGDTTVTVGDVDTVTRYLPANTSAGATITVDLTVDVKTGAAYYSIDEIVPSGWTVTSATDGGDYTSETGHVKWVVTSGATDATYSYTVLVPTDASGAYTFGGIYAFEGMTEEATILGDTTLAAYDSADTNHDCVVSMMELMTQIGKWKSGEVGMMELMTSIGRWKLGAEGYC